jgi:hypothetical protein
MTQRFFGLLTQVGENKQAAAQALNRLVQITHMAVGDANGTSPVPDRLQTALIHETRRAPLNTLKQDPANPNYLIAEQVIPEDAGGWYIREIGLYDADGDLVAVANCPETYKPLLAEGSGRAQVVRLILMVASTTAFQLKIDPSVVLATRQYVDDGLAQKLDKTGTAVAANRLASGRKIGLSGGATGAGVLFDGTADITVVVSDLDMSKATAGTLAVARGGTGLATVAAGSYLRGAGTAAMEARTPAQVYGDLGIASAISTAIAALVASSPATLDTLNEIAQALGNDPNFATTITNLLALKAPLDSPNLTGTPKAPTAAKNDKTLLLVNTTHLQNALADFPRAYSILALPGSDIGPITVIEACEVWTWVHTAYFEGYRSPLCGRPLDGHTLAPLASEVDAVGGLLSKTAYARLWGYAQENGLTVTPAVWASNVGAHFFADVDANNFRVPDLRNMFRRFTGTDADTANARALGSRQLDALQNIYGSIPGSGTQIEAATGAFQLLPQPAQYWSGTTVAGYDGFNFDASRVARASSETRPFNTAFRPRIHA